jgi:hypothetical protein
MTFAATCAPRKADSSKPTSFHSGKYSGGLTILMFVGVWPCDECVFCDMPAKRGLTPCGVRCCVCPAVAAKSRGLTCEPPCGPSCGCGVFAPVPVGVEIFDGISEVKIVAEEGEMRYLDCNVPSNDSLKPMSLLARAIHGPSRMTDLLIVIRYRR